MNQSPVFCSICSYNYLSVANALVNSFLRSNQTDQFHLLIVDRKREEVKITLPRVVVHYVEELKIPNFEKLAFLYDIVELNTAVKPTFLKKLISLEGISSVTYLDPDTFLFSDPRQISIEHEKSAIILSPHALTPHDFDDVPGERMYLKIGTFNLGFVSVGRSSSTTKFLDWWEERCLRGCFSEPYTGLFVDQKWCNLVPVLFEDVLVSKNPGINMGNWNLHERTISYKAGTPIVNSTSRLIFFHFSGYAIDTPYLISKHTPWITLRMRPDLAKIYETYEGELRRTRVVWQEVGASYSYSRFSDGTMVSDLSRKLYLGSPYWSDPNSPFSSSSAWYKWTRRNKISGHDSFHEKATAKSLNRSDRRLKLIHSLLRAVSRIIGPGRYAALLRYLSYVGMLRNQGYVFFENTNCERHSIEVPR